MVSNLLKNKHAYENEKHVYFSVSSFKKYGRLSIITQSRCVIRKLMIAKASIFSPVPKVDGVVLELTPHNKHSNIDIT